MNRVGLQDEGSDWAGITKKTKQQLTVSFLFFCVFYQALLAGSERTGDLGLILISLQHIRCGPSGLIQATGLDGVIMEWDEY